MLQDLVTLIGQYGPWMIFAIVLLEQLGLPLPALPALFIAGALTAGGDLSMPALFGSAVLACLAGDTVWYAAGRRYGSVVLKMLCRISLSQDSCVSQAQASFDRWGLFLLVIAKYVPGLSTVAPPLAGAMRVRWPAFLLFNGTGAMLWTASGLGAGYLMHAQIEKLLARAELLGTGVLLLVAILMVGYIASKWWKRRRLQALLRSSSIDVNELHALMGSGMQPLIVDVRTVTSRALDPRTIPGAMPVEARAMARNFSPALPPQQEVIIFCACPNEAGSVRAARMLMARGYARVRPLLGGLDAWVAAGHEVQFLSATVA